MVDSPESTGAESAPISEYERKRILSATRLKLTLTAFVVTILLVLAGLTAYGVERIFDWLTPSIRADLVHKTQRAAMELSETTELGITIREEEVIADAVRDYVVDTDVIAIVVQDLEQKSLMSYGRTQALDPVFAKRPRLAHDMGEHYGAWASAIVEGRVVGRVGLLVSKARLHAGIQLEKQILVATVFGCCIAVILCIMFVSAYLGPVLALTEQAFLRLEQTTEQALAAAHSKSQFLANMSHEIRTPMNGILGVLDLIHRTELSAKQQRYVQIVESSARGLLTIINDVLDFSKLEAGKYELRNSDFELRQMVQEAAELLAPRAHDKGLEVVTRVDADVPRTITSDPDRIKQVLHNLIGNAIKFTDFGHIEARVSVHSREAQPLVLRFSIADTGVGIKPEDQARLFSVFTQVDESLTRKHGGTGLGLAICRQLASALGGEIGVESAPGRGSTFWFTVATTAGAEHATPASRSARVLVVCSSAASTAQLRELLEAWGMACTSVPDPPSAVQALVAATDRFDVVVLDGKLEQQASEPASLLDLCLGEGLPVIHLLSTSQVARAPEMPRNYILKPLRASELYDGLVNVLDGGTIQQRARKTESPPKRNSFNPARLPVLVVDDNEINRVVACDLAHELGYAAETATNGLEAIEKVRTQQYAVVLMDCQMPELDGYEAARRIRALPAPGNKVPIIALTAHALAGDRDRVLSAGMDDYTTKPIRVRTLETLLRRWDSSDAVARESLAHAAANDNANDSGRASSLAVLLAKQSLRPPNLDAVPDLDPTLPRSPAVVELFLRSVPALFESLAVAMERGETPVIKQLAHKLKGNCLSLGANKLAGACHAVEAAAALGQIHHEAHATLPALFAAVSSKLEAASSTPESLQAGGNHG